MGCIAWNWKASVLVLAIRELNKAFDWEEIDEVLYNTYNIKKG